MVYDKESRLLPFITVAVDTKLRELHQQAYDVLGVYLDDVKRWMNSDLPKPQNLSHVTAEFTISDGEFEVPLVAPEGAYAIQSITLYAGFNGCSNWVDDGGITYVSWMPNGGARVFPSATKPDTFVVKADLTKEYTAPAKLHVIFHCL